MPRPTHEALICGGIAMTGGKSGGFVYILLCADGTLYTGWTTDLVARLKAHNSGKGAKYTRGRLPVRLVYQEWFPDKTTAQKRECAIKRMSRAQKWKLVECQTLME